MAPIARPLYCGAALTDNRAMAKTVPPLTAEQIARAIEVAWDDRPPFNRVLRECSLSHGQVVQLLKRELTPTAFRAWTARTQAARGQPAGPTRRTPPRG